MLYKWVEVLHSNGIQLSKNQLSNNSKAGQNQTVLGYNVYRRNTLNDAEPELVAENLTDTTYTDATWNTMTTGLYQWGVSVIYDAGNAAEYETEAAYSNTLGKDMFTTLKLVVDTENQLSPAGTTVSCVAVADTVAEDITGETEEEAIIINEPITDVDGE